MVVPLEYQGIKNKFLNHRRIKNKFQKFGFSSLYQGILLGLTGPPNGAPLPRGQESQLRDKTRETRGNSIKENPTHRRYRHPGLLVRMYMCPAIFQERASLSPSESGEFRTPRLPAGSGSLGLRRLTHGRCDQDGPRVHVNIRSQDYRTKRSPNIPDSRCPSICLRLRHVINRVQSFLRLSTGSRGSTGKSPPVRPQ